MLKSPRYGDVQPYHLELPKYEHCPLLEQPRVVRQLQTSQVDPVLHAI